MMYSCSVNTKANEPRGYAKIVPIRKMGHDMSACCIISMCLFIVLEARCDHKCMNDDCF